MRAGLIGVFAGAEGRLLELAGDAGVQGDAGDLPLEGQRFIRGGDGQVPEVEIQPAGGGKDEDCEENAEEEGAETAAGASIGGRAGGIAGGHRFVLLRGWMF